MRLTFVAGSFSSISPSDVTIQVTFRIRYSLLPFWLNCNMSCLRTHFGDIYWAFQEGE